MKIDPEMAMSLLTYYIISGVPIAMLVPALATHSSLCPLDSDFLKNGIFLQFSQHGVVSSTEICTFRCLFIVYVIATTIFVIFLRKPLQVAISRRQMRLEGEVKGTTAIFVSFLMLGLFALVPSFLPNLLPLRGDADIYFEQKSAHMLMFSLCAAVWSFGFAFLHWGRILDPDA
ncbi:hypothetical protein [Methylosinus sp. LW3]|uniref:hypothetical protein n=1 Tax=Methylosinus sp. LW3 TaxID=107635 RepID=UPI0012FA57DC|nr:hypothetical protein [Methylosinus sp. LW3]